MKKPASAIALGCAALVLAGCGGGGQGRATADEPVPMPPARNGEQPVSAENLGHLWPLTVPSGVLSCTGDNEAVFTAPDGRSYALNERAERHHPSIEPLRADGASASKISLGALRSKALKLCGHGE